jgi:hypothetical protein
VAVIAVDTNEVIGCFRNLADGFRAKLLFEQVSNFAPRGEDLNELAQEFCYRLFAHQDFERLSFYKSNTLIGTIQRELRHRKE